MLNETADKILHETLAPLADCSFQGISLPKDYQRREKQGETGKLILKNEFYLLPNKGELRTVTVRSPKINILNILFFPEAEQVLPAYAAEFVILSGKPIVAVIDGKYLHSAAKQIILAGAMARARDQVADLLRPEQERPEWFKLSCSGNEIFIRPADAEAMLRIMHLHLTLWKEVAILFSSDASYDPKNSKRHHNNLINYKQRHAANYPGNPLLRRSFGEEWARTYVNNYLFG